MGTVNLLDAVRSFSAPVAVVVVTSDKCYENREWIYGYREEDHLGGHDPYSASKSCAELVASSYRKSFFQRTGAPSIATARAGNVIGGGDWAEDRIIPDCIRSLMKQEPIVVRQPLAIRPWQHVLEPLGGYLWLGALLAAGGADSTAYNFGPQPGSTRNVEALVSEVLKHWPGTWTSPSTGDALHEAGLLNLAIDKAYHKLRWKPVWPFERAVEATVLWYRDVKTGKSGALDRTRTDIGQYCESAKFLGLDWAQS
jgi:CDP-glucose 4,6-dehydratase